MATSEVYWPVSGGLNTPQLWTYILQFETITFCNLRQIHFEEKKKTNQGVLREMWWQPLMFISQLVEGLTPPRFETNTSSHLRQIYLEKPNKSRSFDENVLATFEVYWPVSGGLNTPSV